MKIAVLHEKLNEKLSAKGMPVLDRERFVEELALLQVKGVVELKNGEVEKVEDDKR